MLLLQSQWCGYAGLSMVVCLLCISAAHAEMVFAEMDW